MYQSYEHPKFDPDQLSQQPNDMNDSFITKEDKKHIDYVIDLSKQRTDEIDDLFTNCLNI